MKYRRLLSFRAFQFDYGYTRLPNGSSNDQNLFRISSGVTVHLFNQLVEGAPFKPFLGLSGVVPARTRNYPASKNA